ncbi:hypothetical protein FIBSPDRAFT_175932 [Athelia psychrophila]|uniref:Xylanolytic transcriptional activator regulatory domain-containing protein n=1 Tax=Athelia psychrophila TaxID=1759441 RepID=A0A166ALR4_9AGAM|nr:hypothetical protein FIBSPDRAFT_175932 [Fibularhizoctonia sp. CBS 109695]
MSDSDTLEKASASTGHTLTGGKRQRSRQIKCDAQDTFPAPCSRCVGTQPTPLCRVDPNYRRSRKRPVKATDAPSSTNRRTSISSSLSTPLARNIELAISSASTLPRPLVPLVPLTQVSGLATVISDEQLAQAIWPSVFELGGVHVSIEQATTLFDEFFEHFHPSCPMFLTSRAPVPTHRTDPLLFWAILAVASRGPPLPSGMQKILQGVSYEALAEQVKASVAALGIYPPRTPSVVQALLLLCEWPLPAKSSRDDRTWHYSSLAIQTALQIGLHRPQFPHEFTSRIEEQVAAETVEGQERTLAWIYCHIIGYRYASSPALMLLFSYHTLLL